MKFLKELLALKLPRDSYAVFGSGPLGVRGLKDINDLDLIVKKDLWESLLKTHPLIDGKKIVIGDIEIFNSWMPPFEKARDVDILIDRADIIKGVRYVRLADVLVWKTFRNAEKDFKDIEAIEKFLKIA